MHPAQIKWRSHPNAHRRRSRRSCTRLGKRTHASQRPRNQPKPQRHSQPKRAPAAKAAAAAPGWANAPTQVKGRAPSSNPGGTATQTRTGGEAAAAAPGWANAPTQVKGHAPSSNLGGTTNPNAHRRPKPPQQYPAGYTHQRETKAKHPVQTPAAKPTQTRTGGTAAAAAPGRISAPTRD